MTPKPKPEDVEPLIDHTGVETGEPKPHPLGWEAPGERDRRNLRSGQGRRRRRPR